MKTPPSMDAIADKVTAIVEQSVSAKEPLKRDAPLAKVQGFDSLDLIETSFALQEFFGFELSDQSAIEALSDAMGDDSIIRDGKLTPLGKEMVFRRMPEMKTLDLPEALPANELQLFFTVETFARLVREFYLAAPDTDPGTGEPTELDGFKIVARDSRSPVDPPSGDEIIARWVAETAAELKQERKV